MHKIRLCACIRSMNMHLFIRHQEGQPFLQVTGHHSNPLSSAPHLKRFSGHYDLSVFPCSGLNRNFNSLLVTAPINAHDSKSSGRHTLLPTLNLKCEYNCHPFSEKERAKGENRAANSEKINCGFVINYINYGKQLVSQDWRA